jgi:hypothetical protein
MATTGRTLIDPPVLRPAPYGLYSVATVTEDGDQPQRWEAGGIEFTSLGCSQGAVWATGCGPAFAVTLTKTAVANQWSADLTPNVGPYEISIAAAPYVALLDGGVFVTASAGATVIIRETTGLRRQIVLANVSNVAATNATISGSSSTQAYNDPKAGVGKTYVQADPFMVIAGVACGSLGTLDVDDQDRARASLAAAEPRLVERTFERGNIVPALVSASTVTPNGATAVSVKRAVGLLETYLRSNYSGVGALHAAPILAEYMRPTKDGNVLRTRLGTPIAFGSGYAGVNPTTGAAAPANQVWLYATGAIIVRRSQVQLPATGAETLNRVTNQTLMIAERSIMVAVDCVPPAAVLVDLAGEDA